MSMNGVLLPKIRRKPRCKHFHYSGRKCQQPQQSSFLGAVDGMCGLHRNMDRKGDDRCKECSAMKRAFQPSAGW